MSPPRPILTISAAEAERRLKAQLTRGESLIAELDDDFEASLYQLPGWPGEIRGKYDTWVTRTFEVLARSFSDDEYGLEFRRRTRLSESGRISVPGERRERPDPLDVAGQLRKRVASGTAFVGDVIEILDLAESAPKSPDGSDGTAIFLVHGRDNRRDEVARFLETTTKRRVVILHERPSRGATLVEKLEQAGRSAAFAVVMATADDEGRTKPDAQKPSNQELRPRARQNVVLELGYFFGVLNRAHVAVLLDPGVEQPSDIHGLVYIAFDGEWKIELGRELKAAGIDCDLGA